MRTQDQIKAEMNGIQATIPELSALTSGSDAGFFGLLKFMWVMLLQSLDDYFDKAVADVMALLANTQVGSLYWYVDTVKQFQLGDKLGVYDGVRVGYALADPAKQIIKQAAVVEQPDGRLLMKVAKAGSGKNLFPLLADELQAVREYVRQVKYAGVAVDVVSFEADQLRLEVTVQYNRQVLNGAGGLIASATTLAVVERVNEYLRQLPFDSVINWNALTDYMQLSGAVVDFQIKKSATRAAGTTAWIDFTRETVSRAGHMTLSTESTFTYV